MSVGLLGKVHRWIRRGGGSIPSSVLPETFSFLLEYIYEVLFERIS